MDIRLTIILKHISLKMNTYIPIAYSQSNVATYISERYIQNTKITKPCCLMDCHDWLIGSNRESTILWITKVDEGLCVSDQKSLTYKDAVNEKKDKNI